MRLYLVTAALLCAGGWIAFASDVHPRVRPPRVERRPTTREQIERELDRVVTWKDIDLRVNELPQFLMHELEVPVHVQRLEIGRALVGEDVRIRGSAMNLPARLALTTLLRQQDLACSIEHDYLLITSATAVDEKYVERVYPVRDLVLSKTPGGELLEPDALISAITANVSPDSWRMAGGNEGSISFVPLADALVLRQTARAHDEIADILWQLRRARDGQPIDPPAPQLMAPTLSKTPVSPAESPFSDDPFAP